MSELSSVDCGGRLRRRPAVSLESNRLVRDMEKSWQHYSLPATRQRIRVRDRFEALACQWREETQYLSSTTQIVGHPAYLKIIALGEAVLPCILRELEREPRQWAPALNAITDADPTKPEDWGDMEAIAAAWLNWARAQGIRW